MPRPYILCALLWFAATSVAQEIGVPRNVTAGEDVHLSVSGSGTATLYLFGPGLSNKRDVILGRDIQLPATDFTTAGEYSALLCSAGDCRGADFFVSAAKPFSLTFLVHPSRVPVAEGDAISGVAVPFDKYRNLVLEPETIKFELTDGKASVLNRSLPTKNGIAWFRTASGKSAGALQVDAAIGDISTRRAVQQVASDPCNLRITGQRNAGGILVQTEPVHDCSGNPLPDGTIVTFTATSSGDKSTVDAPIKQDVARAQIIARGPTTVSAASGVVTGNELRIGDR